MEAKGVKITRWQKPYNDLIARPNSELITLLRINSNATNYTSSSEELTWLTKGNHLVIVGILYPVTDAPFDSQIQTDDGKIKIETGRRNYTEKNAILQDDFGAIIWRKNIGKGDIKYFIPQDFAANAYQQYLNNYEFLAKLVSNNNNQIFVDEYLHGYKDEETIQKETGGSLVEYFLKQPLTIVLLQLGIIGIIFFLASLRRFSKLLTVPSVAIDNNTAYIGALAGVLRQANSTNFVVETIAKESQLKLQKKLGLDNILLDSQTLIDAWVARTERSETELAKLLSFTSKNTETDNIKIIEWIEKWQNIYK
jgi:hypothetical protein